MIDLGAEHKDIILKILRQRVPCATVYVFGSRAKGTARRSSDLDLALLSDMPIDARTLAELEVDFSDSDLPFFVDVVDLLITGKDFQSSISHEWIVFYDPGRIQEVL